MRKLLILLIIILMQINVQAQSMRLQVFGDNESVQIVQKLIPKNVNLINEVEANQFLQTTLINLRSQGYLGASIDSFEINDTLCKSYWHVGKQYKWANINVSMVPEIMLNSIGYNRKQFTNQIISEKQLAQLCEKLLLYCDNNGYPFATIYLDSIAGNEAKITANLNVEKNYLIKIDSIDVQGNVEISDGFLNQYLGVKKGDVYDESKLKTISNRIRELSFMQEEKPWRMSFNITRSILTLYLKNKDANRADLLVGLLPNNNALGGKFLLTGDVKLALVNSLRGGESITLNWQNLQYKSPRLIIETVVPYLLKTPIGITAKFHYTKNDSSFRNVIGELGAQYMITANRLIKFYTQINNSALITIDTNNIKAFKQLPNTLDMNTNTFGVEWQWNQTDFKLNPRKGFSVALNGNAGIRNISKNTAIENLFDASSSRKFAYLYDSISLRSFKYTATVLFNYFVPLSKRFTNRFAYSGGVVYNPTLFRNELFQIGGYRLLRGFDEASLFVNQYQVLMLEPRYLLSQNSYLFTFADVAILNSKYIDANKLKQGLGIGAGISLETRNGMFNFMYALGNNLSGGIQFRNSKIHFGYVNTF
jgi:outer membrane protein assembly factor BamA